MIVACVIFIIFVLYSIYLVGVLDDIIEDKGKQLDNTISIDGDLKDMIISAFRYSIGRKTYITWSTCDYIKEHSNLIDKRVKQVLLNDLEQLDMYYPDKGIDYNMFIDFKKWLEDFEVSDE